jgi:O-antigen/teichoic acid export membrane protein
MLLFQDLFLKNRVWTIVALSAGTSILNVLLNIILIPMKGALGAAFATVISYDVIPIVYYISRTGLFTKRK